MSKNTLAKLFRPIFYTSQSGIIDFHHVLLIKALKVTIAIAFFGSVVNLFIGLPWALTLFGFATCFIFLAMLVLVANSQYVETIKKLYIASCFAVLNALWFANSGIDGTVLLMSVLFLVILIFLSSGKVQKRIVVFYLVNITVLFALQLLFPDLIEPYADKTQRHIDLVIMTFIVLTATVPIMLYIQQSYVNGKLKAEESERIKASFLANMSHEIRTPMNSILGFSELLRDDELTAPDKLHYLEIIQENGKVLLQLLNNIMEISKLDAQIVKPNIRAVNLSRLFEQVYLSHKNELDAKNGVTFKMNLPPDDNAAVIYSDELMLYQVMCNLLGNAIKYTPEGFIEIGFYADDSHSEMVLYVSDSGIGIDERKAGSIFNRFSQGEESYTRQYGGVGLGLAISLELARLLHGDISVSSEVGKGSLFKVMLPLTKVGSGEIGARHRWN